MKTDQKKLGELVLWLIILIVCLAAAIYVMITGNRQRSQKNTADQGTMETVVEAADPDDAVSGVVEINNDE